MCVQCECCEYVVDDGVLFGVVWQFGCVDGDVWICGHGDGFVVVERQLYVACGCVSVVVWRSGGVVDVVVFESDGIVLVELFVEYECDIVVGGEQYGCEFVVLVDVGVSFGVDRG